MRPKGQTFYTFVETEVFTRQLKALASIETLHAIESDLIANPERCPVIPGTKGARKGRVADTQRSRGKAAVSVTCTCTWNTADAFTYC